MSKVKKIRDYQKKITNNYTAEVPAFFKGFSLSHFHTPSLLSAKSPIKFLQGGSGAFYTCVIR